MVIGDSQKCNTIASVDEILLRGELQDIPRALLLLRVCQFTLEARPDVIQYYWKQLAKVKNFLNGKYAEAFSVLQEAIEPPRSEKYKGFIREIINRINTAFDKESAPKKDAKRILLDCEKRLRKRFWLFGKKPAWIAIVQAWANLDRMHTLKILKMAPHGVQRSLIAKWYRLSPLTVKEWDLAYKHYRNIVYIIAEKLDEEKPILHLSLKLADTLGRYLLTKIHAVAVSPELKSIIEAQRNKARLRYIKLVNLQAEKSPDTAEKLMENFYSVTVTTQRFEDRWTERFFALEEIINCWVLIPSLKEKAINFLVSQNNGCWRDFTLSHWQAMAVTSLEEAEAASRFLEKECDDLVLSEIWFLVTLVKNGMGREALTLARSSIRSLSLLPRIQRAWLSNDPIEASQAFNFDDFKDDMIGKFFMLKSNQARVEFLRNITEKGQKSLPKQMWNSITIEEISFMIRNNNFNGEEDRKFMSLYEKNELIGNQFKERVRINQYAKYDYREVTLYGEENPSLMTLHRSVMTLCNENETVGNQFKEYVNMNGYSKYSYRDLDPHLFSALIAWDDKYPGEVKSLFYEMWNVIQPDDVILIFDILINNIFGRCYTIFSVSPQCLDELFVSWVKKKLVDNSVTICSEDIIHSLSLSSEVPFWLCLLGAEKVSNISQKRCTDILKRALSTYPAIGFLVESAARLFVSNKGLTLSILNSPVDLLQPHLLQYWQIGVIEASTEEIHAIIMGEEQKVK